MTELETLLVRTGDLLEKTVDRIQEEREKTLVRDKLLQLEVEALAEIIAGKPSAAERFVRLAIEMRKRLEEAGLVSRIVFELDPDLERSLKEVAEMEQRRRMEDRRRSP